MSSCTYKQAVERIGLALVREGRAPAGMHDLIVQHDDWCPVVLGDGSRPCEPRFIYRGEDVTHLAQE